MRAVGARFEAQRHHPTSDDPRILSRGQVRAAMDPAGPQEIESNHFRVADPTIERQPGSFSDLKADRLSRLTLGHLGTLLHPPSGKHVPDPQRDEVASAKLAVYGHVEQREVALVVGHFEADPDGPDMPRQERALLTNDAALVPGDASRTKGGEKIVGHEYTSSPPGPPFFGHADHLKIPRLGPGVGASGGRTKPLRGIGACCWRSAPNSALLFV